MSLTCSCADPLETATNDKCAAIAYGNQIVKIFAQKVTGTDFDASGGNTITVEADWDTKLAADDDDRIVVFSNLTNALRPSADPNIEEGNEVTYGGKNIIDRPQSITADFKYLAQSTFRALDQVACWDLVRIWFLDNNGYLWAQNTSTGAGIPDVSVTTGTYAQEGIGTKNRNPMEFSWNNICQPVPVAQLNFLKYKEGSNESGSTL
jgi:hypothetical protein